MFFKRFYTGASCLEHDPLRVMPTCIYLGCKVAVCVCGGVCGGGVCVCVGGCTPPVHVSICSSAVCA
jgi:hypothetical protein